MNESYEFINYQNFQQKYPNFQKFYENETKSRLQEPIQNHEEDALFEE